MDKAPTYVGIDVSKRRLDIHSRPSGECFAVDYDEEGVAALVVLEAAGGMEVRLAADLAAAGLDKTRAEVKLCRARDRLAALREQRSLSFLCRRAWAEGYG